MCEHTHGVWHSCQLFPTKQGGHGALLTSVTKGHDRNLLPADFAGHRASKEATAPAPQTLCPTSCHMLSTTTQTWDVVDNISQLAGRSMTLQSAIIKTAMLQVGADAATGEAMA